METLSWSLPPKEGYNQLAVAPVEISMFCFIHLFRHPGKFIFPSKRIMTCQDISLTCPEFVNTIWLFWMTKVTRLTMFELVAMTSR